jgi:hypothetical protein
MFAVLAIGKSLWIVYGCPQDVFRSGLKFEKSAYFKVSNGITEHLDGKRR